MIQDLFALEMQTKHTNKEDPTEVTDMSEEVFKLTCQIENGANPINSLAEGLKLSLEGDIEKNSPNLGRDAIWGKVSRVNKLVSIAIFYPPINKICLDSPNTSASTSSASTGSRPVMQVAQKPARLRS